MKTLSTKNQASKEIEIKLLTKYMNKRVKITKNGFVVNEFYDLKGTITKSKIKSLADTRRFQHKTIKELPDDIYLWIQFDKPLKFRDFTWKGFWIDEAHDKILKLIKR